LAARASDLHSVRRQRARATNQSDELATLHSTTSSVEAGLALPCLPTG